MATKAQKSSTWFARVDGNREFLEGKLKELAQQIDVEQCLAYHHLGGKKDNSHCHFVIRLSGSPQKQSFAVRIKKLFSIDKKSDYALDVWDGVKDTGAVAYMFHEENAIQLVNKGFTEAELEKAKTANEAVQKVVAINKERASTKLVDKAIERFKDETYEVSNVDILHFMLKEIKDGNSYHPGMYRLKTFVEEVSLKLTRDEDMWGYAQRIADQLWR